MPRIFLIAIFLAIPIFVGVGIGLMYGGWHVGSSIEGPISTDSLRRLMGSLLLIVSGAGAFFIGKALYTVGSDELTRGEYVVVACASMVLYAIFVLMGFRYYPVVTTFGAWILPAPFLLWSVILFLIAGLKPREAT